MLYSCLLGVACINFSADQTLIGTAMNLLATAAATVFVRAMNTSQKPDNVSSSIQYIHEKKAFLKYIGKNYCKDI
jgi:simple sugar transport system permease protein